uniref:Putative ovule protein n=1 Tax=Solanum chacoense TaxID=4108 RepID=A0A0V0GHK7_SOLCH
MNLCCLWSDLHFFQVVAIDRQNGPKLMSFQELSSRERGSKDSIIAFDKIKVLSIFSIRNFLAF